MKELLDFLTDINNNNDCFFIEVEGRLGAVYQFLSHYNKTHSAITIHDEGIMVLSDDVDKWGIELRLYVPYTPPASIRNRFTKNTVYRKEYPYRLNNNDTIYDLFDHGFTIGLN